MGSEQKKMTWCRILDYKFLSLGELDLDPFVNFLTSDTAYLLGNGQRRFAGRDKDVSCLERSMPSVVKLYGFHPISQRSDLPDVGRLMEFTGVCWPLLGRKLSDALIIWKLDQFHITIHSWTLLLPTAVLYITPSLFIALLAAYHTQRGLNRSESCRKILDIININGIPVPLCAVVGVGVMNCTISYPFAALDCYQRWALGKEP